MVDEEALEVAWLELKPHIWERYGSSGAIDRFEKKIFKDEAKL